MRWVITKDHIDTHAVGRGNNALGLVDELPVMFQLFDDDGELYYEGMASEEDFAPLDWAMEYAGCTTMTTWNEETGKWEIL